MKNSQILILGLGNDILSDDGIGPRLVADMSERDPDSKFDYLISASGGLEIIEYLHGYSRIIFIDAIRTTGGKPGDIFHFRPADFKETSNLSNLHDINFITALRLGKTLNLELPSDIHIIAVEIVDDMHFNDKLSLELEEKYPEILRKTESLINKIINVK